MMYSGTYITKYGKAICVRVFKNDKILMKVTYLNGICMYYDEPNFIKLNPQIVWTGL